jgi:hypothetical protein
MEHFLWKTVKKLSIELLHGRAIPLLGTYPGEVKMLIHIMTCK